MEKKGNFFVFCDIRHDGGELVSFDTFEEALAYYSKNIDAERIIYGIEVKV